MQIVYWYFLFSDEKDDNMNKAFQKKLVNGHCSLSNGYHKETSPVSGEGTDSIALHRSVVLND